MKRRLQEASEEKKEALRDFNATQTWRGTCRKCGWRWMGLVTDLPKGCPGCGWGTPDGK